MTIKPEVSYNDYTKLDIRVGTITRAEPFPEARKPAYKLFIDFGEDVGEKQSSAQITNLYTPESLENKQIMAVVNFPPRQVGPFISEVLTLGIINQAHNVVLVRPDTPVPNGESVL